MQIQVEKGLEAAEREKVARVLCDFVAHLRHVYWDFIFLGP